MSTTRYNAGIQRAKGLLEIAAGLYDTSLSHQTMRAAEGMLQTDTRVGRLTAEPTNQKTTSRSHLRPEVFARSSQ